MLTHHMLSFASLAHFLNVWGKGRDLGLPSLRSTRTFSYHRNERISLLVSWLLQRMKPGIPGPNEKRERDVRVGSYSRTRVGQGWGRLRFGK